ncbi:MAG: GH116 family glycosyl hydrolase [Betaproteobacteria bacterium]
MRLNFLSGFVRFRALLFLAMAIAAGLATSRGAAQTPPRTGFPVANFGIGAEVAPTGRLLGRIVYNPPLLGRWLEEAAEGYFTFKSRGPTIRDETFELRTVKRRWPTASVKLSDPRLPGITVDFNAFAPLAADNPFDSSLPVVMSEFTLRNDSKASQTVSVSWVGKAKADEGARIEKSDNLRLVLGSGMTIATQVPNQMTLGTEPGTVQWSVLVPPRSHAHLRILFMRFHENGYTTVRLHTPPQLAAYVFRQWDALSDATQQFAVGLPNSHNPALDDALRWYMTPAALLTKITRDGHVLTMGYSELNQRDSYWTSFVHLIYWPVLEKNMIEESARAQRADGKIPTTILPDIERNDDIDINCYFVLRVFRWTAFHHDTALLESLWPNVKAAIGFLHSMDTDNDGLPEQRSFWADWKDVSGVSGRKYGPHFTLLWLATLRRAAHWAHQLKDEPAAAEFEALYEKGLRTVNLHVKDGGLWNGECYVNVWRDGRRDNRVLEDQVVGVLFGVVDAKRTASVFNALKPNETEWGVRETFPYYPEETFGLRGGDYHNGAIWPWLNFADALARIRSGRIADGVRIMEKVARADLTLHGDFLPHENIDGETGENTHMYLQGWDAAFFAALYFGLIEPDAEFF